MNCKNILRKPAYFWLLVIVPFLLATFWFGGAFLPGGGKIIEQGPGNHRVVAITFDDGPSPATTDILEILDQYKAKATFFVCGCNVERYPEIAALILDKGCQIANHSNSHSEYLRFLLPHQVVNDYNKAENTIYEATGLKPRFYRAPFGRTSPWMRWALARKGLQLVGWDNSSGDWEDQGRDELIDRVTQNVYPGTIILLHDGHRLVENPDRSELIQALPAIIEKLQSQGYQLVTIAEMLGEDAYF